MDLTIAPPSCMSALPVPANALPNAASDRASSKVITALSGLETVLARFGASEGDDLSAGRIAFEKSSDRMPWENQQLPPADYEFS